jgi:hypothetical protein
MCLTLHPCWRPWLRRPCAYTVVAVTEGQMPIATVHETFCVLGRELKIVLSPFTFSVISHLVVFPATSSEWAY